VNEPREDAVDRAIARALDMPGTADDADGAGDDAVREYREVLSHLPFDEVPPPAGLEDRVVAAAAARRPASVVPIAHRESARRRATARAVGFGATAVAAAAVIAFALAPRGDGGPDARIEQAASSNALDAVLAAEGTRAAALGDAGSVALASDGTGYLYDLTLEPGDYTLALTTSDREIDVGRFSTGGSVLAFEVDGDVGTVTGAVVRAGETVVATATF